MNEVTRKIRGVGAVVRMGGYGWRATAKNLGGDGTDYAKFSGRWIPTISSHIPGPVYRELRKQLRAAIATALGK